MFKVLDPICEPKRATKYSACIDLDYPNEIGLILHNPIKTRIVNPYPAGCYTDVYFPQIKLSKGDKIAQAMLMEHKSYLMGYESDVVRNSGFGSTGK